MDTKKQSTLTGYAAGLTAVLFWSVNVIIAHWMTGKLEPAQVSLGRWIVAGIILVPFTIVNITRTWASFRQHLWRNILLALGIGVISISIQNTLVYMAGHTATAIDMALIGTCGPIFLALLSAFVLHQPIRLMQGIGLVSACLGVLFLIAHGDLARLSSFNFVIGDLYMLVVSFSFAVYTLLLTLRPKDLAPATMLGMSVVVGVGVLSAYVGLTQGAAGFYIPETKVLAVLVYMGIFPSVCSFICWNIALSHLGTLRTGIMYYTMPLLSSIEAYFLLGESMNLSQIWGACLILGGVVFAAQHHKIGPAIAQTGRP
ncbi:MAG: DMT family transporter [Desulfovibrionaceae bacterium]